MTTTITVKGMTCGHCVSAVSQELGRIEGVSSVDVDLETGKVTIESETDLEDAAVRAAVDEAGFEIA